MNIQIFGRGKCFDTKKAERWFKERRIRYQYIDMDRYGMSRGEFTSVAQSAGLAALTDPKSEGAELLPYLAYDRDREDKLFDNQRWVRTPVVRNGRKATVGYCPDVWKDWE